MDNPTHGIIGGVEDWKLVDLGMGPQICEVKKFESLSLDFTPWIACVEWDA